MRTIALCLLVLIHGHNISALDAAEPEYGFTHELRLPQLVEPPVVDGDLSEWRNFAYHDGIWDLNRLQHEPWYESDRNRLTLHVGEDSTREDVASYADDLSARYYMAWDSDYLYLGAEVSDNVNDVIDPDHEPSRWYFKDAICWFVEAPFDEIAEEFGQGGHGFCFVIDESKPDYGAWWRHGNENENYIEEPIPRSDVDYEIVMDPDGSGRGDFVLEARVLMKNMMQEADPNWRPAQIGDEYGLSIVHTDPDGGEYGGHYLIYGIGRNDGYWAKATLVGPDADTRLRRLAK